MLWHKAAIVLAALALGFGSGWRVHAWKTAADEQADREQQAKVEHMRREKIDAAATKFEESREAAEIRERVVVKEVQRVVEKPVYRGMCLDDDGLRLLADDIAASNARRQLAPALPAASSPH